MGPASGGLHVLTLRKKARKGVGYSGTPWSGQAVNWNWRTSRFSLEPFWKGLQRYHLSLQPFPHPQPFRAAWAPTVQATSGHTVEVATTQGPAVLGIGNTVAAFCHSNPIP